MGIFDYIFKRVYEWANTDNDNDNKNGSISIKPDRSDNNTDNYDYDSYTNYNNNLSNDSNNDIYKDNHIAIPDNYQIQDQHALTAAPLRPTRRRYPYTYDAKCVKVIDGDTVVLDVYGFKSVSENFKFRLFGIDTPEMDSKIAAEREKARQAKAFVEKKILNQIIEIQTLKDAADGFGRYLCVISYDAGLSDLVELNTELINEGLAVKFMV